MPSSFKLVRNNLKLFYYHWFWGLSFGYTAQVRNLAIEVEKLLHHEDRLSQLTAHQMQYEKYPVLVQYIYWFFNINNIAHDAYVLAAYKGYQENNIDAGKSTETLDFLNKASSLGNVTYGTKRLCDLAQRDLPFYQQSEPHVNKQKEQEPKPETEKTEMDPVKVTSSMLPHLEVLGIYKKIGEELSALDLKTASKTMFLKTHPDKGGSHEAFCAVKNAVERMKALITKSSDYDSIFQDLLTAICIVEEKSKKVEHRLKKAEDQAQILGREIAELQDKLNKFRKERNLPNLGVGACTSQEEGFEPSIKTSAKEALSMERISSQVQNGFFENTVSSSNNSSVEIQSELGNLAASTVKS